MSRSGVFYAIKAMERVAAGTTGADAPGVAPGGAVAHDARAAASPDGSASSIVLRGAGGRGCWPGGAASGLRRNPPGCVTRCGGSLSMCHDPLYRLGAGTAGRGTSPARQKSAAHLRLQPTLQPEAHAKVLEIRCRRRCPRPDRAAEELHRPRSGPMHPGADDLQSLTHAMPLLAPVCLAGRRSRFSLTFVAVLLRRRAVAELPVRRAARLPWGTGI